MYNIGIITLYYNNDNYGGVLQAFALQSYLEKEGYNVTQISYSNQNYRMCLKERVSRLLNGGVESLINVIRLRITRKEEIPIDIKKNIEQRKNKFRIIRDEIPHTDFCDEKTINQYQDSFDVVIAGSDQIWIPGNYSPNYFLHFVSARTKKIVYGASLARRSLTRYEKRRIKKSIRGINHISVRESSAKDIIQGLCDNQKIKVVLDPTFLIEKEEWDKLCKQSSIGEQEPYIFVYMLGKRQKNYAIIRDISDKMHLPIRYIPYISNDIGNEIVYGEPVKQSVGPLDFLKLIKEASYVVTDSFHGCVFSIIFEKQFFALERHKKESKFSMNDRIYDLLSMFHLTSRSIDNIEVIDINHEIDYGNVKKISHELQQKSKEFLKNGI